MSISNAVEATPHLAGQWKPGLQALRAEDKPHIQPENPRALTGSVDVDSALMATEPNAHRWDFGIGYQHANRERECIYWVELHTASDSEVNRVLDKLRWLRAWLRGDGHRLAAFEREFVWVSSGATTFTLNAPKQKQFAVLGLLHSGRILRIRDIRP